MSTVNSRTFNTTELRKQLQPKAIAAFVRQWDSADKTVGDALTQLNLAIDMSTGRPEEPAEFETAVLLIHAAMLQACTVHWEPHPDLITNMNVVVVGAYGAATADEWLIVMRRTMQLFRHLPEYPATATMHEIVDALTHPSALFGL